nr:SDR family oxidoreductase [uncultured Chitinophaga sp.]
MDNTTSSTNKSYQPETLSGKRVLITGGTTGIGRTTALLLAEQGATVMIFGRHAPELEDTLQQFRDKKLEKQVHGFTADIATEAGIQQVFEQVDQQMSGLDILINNAGLPFGGISEGSYKDWQYLVNTNLLSYMACAQEAIWRMQPQQKGQIVFIGSLSAKVRSADSSVYSATKAGVQAFAEALRKETISQGIKISLIEPGLVDTDLLDMDAAKRAELLQENKMLITDDIAACVAYILTQPWRSNFMMARVAPVQQEL